MDRAAVNCGSRSSLRSERECRPRSRRPPKCDIPLGSGPARSGPARSGSADPRGSPPCRRASSAWRRWRPRTANARGRPIGMAECSQNIPAADVREIRSDGPLTALPAEPAGMLRCKYRSCDVSSGQRTIDFCSISPNGSPIEVFRLQIWQAIWSQSVAKNSPRSRGHQVRRITSRENGFSANSRHGGVPPVPQTP